MGSYNFHVPQILGQEWVGIRDESVTLSPAVNLTEIGHEFTLATNRQVSSGRYYVKSYPPAPSFGQVNMVTVYAAGTEAQSGPVRRVVIPVNSAPATGSGITPATNAARVASVLSPADEDFILVQPYTAAGQKSIDFFFNTSAYAQLLNGKRILAVNLLYTLSWEPEESGTTVVATKDVVYNPSQALTMRTGSGSTLSQQLAPFRDTFGNGLLYLPDLIVGTLGDGSQVGSFGLGEVNPMSNTPPATFTTDQWPWRYQELARFEETAGINRTWIHFDFGDTNALGVYTGDMQLGYLAMEVLFCEEKRILFGGIKKMTTADYILGQNQVTMRDLALNANPVLLPGTYTVALEMPDVGDLPGSIVTLGQSFAKDQTYPVFNGLRELYEIPTHPGRQVNLTRTEDEEFSVEETLILPQLSLHASGASGPLTEVHVYGQQARAQVYGNFTATQEILDSAAGGARSYPWVRFYARRFGNTTVPLKLDSPTITGTGLSVQITPVEFDALDEIVDGWKEVTLRFTTAPTMGAGTNPQWRWSAIGETNGNRWEVLGVTAPALSGIPGNLLNLAPSASQLSTATYGAPSAGSTINMGWMPQYAPPVSAPADDTTTDAVLMFALDMQTVTGFGIAEQSQTLVGIGLDCGVNPCCIPSAIKYNRLTWSQPVNTNFLSDNFNRTVAASSWGTSSGGQAWSAPGAGITAEVNGTQGVLTSTTATTRIIRLTTGGVDQDVRATVTLATAVVSGDYNVGLMFRVTDSSNYYSAKVIYTTTQVELRLVSTVAGVNATLASVFLTNLLPSTTSQRQVRVMIVGNRILAKLWADTEEEPTSWMLDITDNTFTTGDGAGISTQNLGGNTTVVYNVDNFSVTPPDINFGYYELQRMDTVDTDWATIMKATSTSTTGFSDYEARVGILSSYRIRAVDVYDFPGQWSATVTNTLTEPGVTIGCTGGHLLLFTSNEEQDGSINLAYSSVWEDRVQEDFTFPEARFVELQAMYNRDFFTAFRPTERGGEQFSRTVLVQAAAIAPETLADFTSLRDMAWANTSYICVRDEDGNRWFATVLVPSGRVVHNRTLYMAPVEIIEVTDTPSQVDP